MSETNKKLISEKSLYVFIFLYICVYLLKINNYWIIFTGAYLMASVCLKINKVFCLFCLFMFFTYPSANAIYFCIILIVGLIKYKTIKITRNPCLYLILFYVGWNLICSVFAVNLLAAMNDIITWCYISCLYIFVLSILTKKEIAKVISSLSMAGVVLSFLFVIKRILPELFFKIAGVNFIRLPDTNYSAIILLTLLICVKIFVSQNPSRWRLLKEICLAIGIIATGSRGVLALLLGFYIFIFTKQAFTGMRKKEWIKILLFMVIILVCVGTLKPLQDAVYELGTITSTKVHSNNVRIELYTTIIKNIIPQFFLFGAGPNSFLTVYPEYTTIRFEASHAHSIYLHTLIETGFLGLLLVLLFFGVIVYQLFKERRGKAKYCNYRMYIFIVGIYMAYGLVEHVWADSRSLGLFIILAGCFEVERRAKDVVTCGSCAPR